MAMDKNHCIVKFRGESAIYDTKYPFLRHPNLKLTAIPRDGSGIPYYVRDRKTIRASEKVITETKPIEPKVEPESEKKTG
jgi:hypothetical protein